MSDLPDSPNVTAEQLALLSHEFRTPLNGVLGMARLLEGTRLSPEQKDYVSALRASGEHLLSLVNEVLSFAKLGSNEVELHAAPVDVEDLLRSVCELMSPRAAEKRLEVAWAAPSDLGRIHADEGRLRQILLNFAGNAIKFTERGGVLLSVARVGDSRLKFTVADTGPGVSEAAAEKEVLVVVEKNLGALKESHRAKAVEAQEAEEEAALTVKKNVSLNEEEINKLQSL